MPYIIVVRNPRSNKLIIVAIDDGDDSGLVAEFQTAEEAEAAAQNTTVCQAWPYDVVEVLV